MSCHHPHACSMKVARVLLCTRFVGAGRLIGFFFECMKLEKHLYTLRCIVVGSDGVHGAAASAC